MPRIRFAGQFRVERPRSVRDVVGQLPGYATPVFVALKLAGVVDWSWWWVLSPLWIAGLALVLLVSGLVVLWCLGQWSHILLNLLPWRRRRQWPVFVTFEQVNADPDASDG